MKTILFIIPFLFLTNLTAQQWINCTNGFHVKDGIEQGDILWVATLGGLVKKNISTGEQEIFNRGNSPIPSNDIQSILLDTEGRVWISTGLGTAILDDTDWTIFYDKFGILRLDEQDNVVLAQGDSLHTWNGQAFESEHLENAFLILTDFEINPNNGVKWLSLFSFGIYTILRYDDQGVQVFDDQNSPLPWESSGLNPLLIDDQDRLWAGNYYGLYRYDGENWFDFSSELADFPEGNFNAIEKDEEGNVWAIVQEWDKKTLIKISEDDSFEVFDMPDFFLPYANIPYLEISSEEESTIYVGTTANGLWKFDIEEWTYLNTSQSEYVSNETNQIYIDEETTYILGGRFLYSDPLSLSAFTEEEWKVFKESDLPTDLVSDFPRTIVGRHLDTLWIHCADTLLAYVDGNWSLPQIPEILPDVKEINSFSYHAPNGNRWLLEKYQSYIFYESDQGWEVFEHEEHGAVSGNYESYFTHPVTGDFWLASANGLSRYDGNNWTKMDPEDYGMNTTWVFELELDENGTIWGVTSDAIFKIENNVPVIFTDFIPGINNLNFRSIEFDTEGKMWVGSNNAIAYLEGDEWIVLDYKNSGVPNGLICELEFDHLGNLWLGSTKGGFAVYNENGLPAIFTEDFHTSIEEGTELNSQSSIVLYPNPTVKNDELNIRVNEAFLNGDNYTISIFSADGKKLLEKRTNERIARIPLNGITSPGTYILKFESKSALATKSFVVH